MIQAGAIAFTRIRVRRPLDGERLGQVDDRGGAGGVGGAPRQAAVAADRAHVDDRAAACPRAIIWRAAAWAPANCPSTVASKTLRKSARVSSTEGREPSCSSGCAPRRAGRAGARPRVDAARRVRPPRARRPGGSTPRPLPPAPARSAASASSPLMSATTTDAPSRAKASAVAAPIPPPPPMSRQTLPLRAPTPTVFPDACPSSASMHHASIARCRSRTVAR